MNERGLKRASLQSKHREELLESYISEALAKRAKRAKRVHVTHPRGTFAGFEIIFLAVLVSTTLVGLNPLTGVEGCDARISSPQVAERRIAILDPMGSSNPDPAFIAGVRSSAEKAGYGLDYYPPETVTVNLFATLPQRAYGVIILRTHGYRFSSVISTGEGYSQYNHLDDQFLNNLGALEVDGTTYYYLTPRFITHAMCGRLPGTVVLAMGCGATSNLEVAKAFVVKGASAFVGWDSTVTVSQTDIAFGELTKLLLAGNGLGSSVDHVMQDMGPDPIYGSRISYYPVDETSFALQVQLY